jgi:hypothetical protein
MNPQNVKQKVAVGVVSGKCSRSNSLCISFYVCFWKCRAMRDVFAGIGTMAMPRNCKSSVIGSRVVVSGS